MALPTAINVHHLPPPPPLTPRFPPAASNVTVMAAKRSANDTIQDSEHAKEKIRQMFQKVELSVSAYDTAWVAMAPCPSSPRKPCFPGSVDWILENQLQDGSWGLADRDPSLVKDTLSSTLSCVLALKTWNVGEQQIMKGLDYIASNFASAMNNEKLISPIGFDVIFPSLVEKAIDLNVNLRLPPTHLDALLQKKDTELKRIQGQNLQSRNFYQAYISEALGKSQDWRMIMTHQHKNGSLFNSPSTTAAAFTALQDSHCHNYLSSVLQKFGNAVPALYPAEAYFRLYMVDILRKLGISRHFKESISQVMDETFRQWKEGDEDIFSDLNTCILAFRLLRQHGYDVSSELMAEKNCYLDQFGGNLEDTRYAFELYIASQIKLYDHESYLDENVSDCQHFLERQTSDHIAQADSFGKSIKQEVADTLRIPYHATVERLENRKYIENHNWDGKRVLKSSLRYVSFSNKDLLQLAKDDFSYCQSIQNEELKRLQRWVVESKLDTLTFSRQKLGYCYFSGAATLFFPEQTDARISWAKNGVLTTVVDDFFDVGSSAEEQLNLMQLLAEWGDAKTSTKACSENVEIIFSAVSGTIREIGEKARSWQDHDVTKHVTEIWLSLMKAMWLESEWSRNKALPPTMEEYMENAYTSFALGPIVLPALYLIGPKLPEKVIRSAEYHTLFKLMSTFGRLVNDIQGYQREAEDGKPNAVSLQALHGGGSVSKEDVVAELRKTMSDSRRELLRMVLRNDEHGGVPRECRDVFWKMSKVLHFFYEKDDGFTSNELKNVVKSILYDPIDAV